MKGRAASAARPFCLSRLPFSARVQRCHGRRRRSLAPRGIGEGQISHQAPAQSTMWLRLCRGTAPSKAVADGEGDMNRAVPELTGSLVGELRHWLDLRGGGRRHSDAPARRGQRQGQGGPVRPARRTAIPCRGVARLGRRGGGRPRLHRTRPSRDIGDRGALRRDLRRVVPPRGLASARREPDGDGRPERCIAHARRAAPPGPHGARALATHGIRPG